jgi:hypothetical protein
VCVSRRHEGTDPLPQELSYLHLCPPKAGADQVVLLASDTELGVACAQVIQAYAQQVFPLTQVDLVQLPGLDPTQDRLQDTALDALAREVDAAVRRSHQVVLNISGGFKGLIPYATCLAAIYPQVELLYLYQTATAPTTLSALPVSFDAAAWRDWRALIKSVDKMPTGSARQALVRSLPPALRPLFKEDGQLGFLGRALSHRFQNERIDQLNLHGQGDQLLALLPPGYRQPLEAQLPVWHYSTVGDKVPEMVDHGRGHLQRVQELLTQVLIPLHQVEPNFFHPEELVALIGALWLHDSGHSAESLRLPLGEPFQGLCNLRVHLPTAGFPSLSRDLHQLLIANLLLDPTTRQAYLIDPAFWTSERVTAMLWVCLYHRRSMPLVEGAKPFEFGNLLRVTEPCPETCEVNGQAVRVRLLAALYSLCDGCDTQAERAATDDELFARRHLLYRGVEALLDQAKIALDSPASPPPVRQVLQAFLDHRPAIASFCLSGQGSIEETLEQLEKEATRCLHAYLGETHWAGRAPSLEQAAVHSILDRLQFLARQSGFYTHHRAVQAVYATYLGQCQGLHSFRICASGDPTRVRPIVLGAQAGKKGGFASELERSGPVLQAAGLEIVIDEESLVGPT